MILPAISTVLSGRLFVGGKKCEALPRSRMEYHKGKPECKWEPKNAKVKLEVVRRFHLTRVNVQSL